MLTRIETSHDPAEEKKDAQTAPLLVPMILLLYIIYCYDIFIHIYIPFITICLHIFSPFLENHTTLFFFWCFCGLLTSSVRPPASSPQNPCHSRKRRSSSTSMKRGTKMPPPPIPPEAATMRPREANTICRGRKNGKIVGSQEVRIEA